MHARCAEAAVEQTVTRRSVVGPMIAQGPHQVGHPLGPLDQLLRPRPPQPAG